MMHCYLCSAPLRQQLTWKLLFTSIPEPVVCEKCLGKFERVLDNEQKYENVFALYHYNEAMHDYLHQFKFGQDVVLAEVFRSDIATYLKNSCTSIVPIPMHPLKKKERTFAQVDELLRAASIPYTHCLEKMTTQNQATKTKLEREQSEQFFSLKEDCQIENIDYLLVDDIVTTGTTLKHATTLLMEAGARKVTSFTLIQG